jgi:hypothetical protein
MEKVEKYRTYIEQIIKDYGCVKPSYGNVDIQILFDHEHDHYQLSSIGWDDDQRIYGCLLHLDIKNGKIWIQHDGTEIGIAKELVALSVPKEDIVLAYHPPYKRPHTGYAVG